MTMALGPGAINNSDSPLSQNPPIVNIVPKQRVKSHTLVLGGPQGSNDSFSEVMTGRCVIPGNGIP